MLTDVLNGRMRGSNRDLRLLDWMQTRGDGRSEQAATDSKKRNEDGALKTAVLSGEAAARMVGNCGTGLWLTVVDAEKRKRQSWVESALYTSAERSIRK